MTQTAAELLVFVQKSKVTAAAIWDLIFVQYYSQFVCRTIKSKMAAAAILNYYFVTPDHPRSQFAVLNLLFKFCVDRVYTF